MLQVVEFVQHFEEVPDRAGHAIEGPDQDDVEAVLAGIGQQLIEPGPPGLGAGDHVACIHAGSRSRAGPPSRGGHGPGSPDAGRWSRPSDKGRRASCAPLLQALGVVLLDILFDELDQDVGHVLALGRRWPP